MKRINIIESHFFFNGSSSPKFFHKLVQAIPYRIYQTAMQCYIKNSDLYYHNIPLYFQGSYLWGRYDVTYRAFSLTSRGTSPTNNSNAAYSELNVASSGPGYIVEYATSFSR